MQRLNIQTHPELSQISFVSRLVTYTKHAKERAIAKNVILTRSIHINAGDVVELEMTMGKLSKLVVRQEMTSEVDRVLVLIPDKDIWRCITVWTNRRDDNHATLQLSRITA